MMFLNINLRELINWRLYGILLLTLLLPAIYTTVRLYFLGNLPSTTGIDIASSIIVLSLIYEVFTEALIFPLYYLIGIVSHKENEFWNRVKSSFLLIIFSPCVFLLYCTY